MIENQHFVVQALLDIYVEYLSSLGEFAYMDTYNGSFIWKCCIDVNVMIS